MSKSTTVNMEVDIDIDIWDVYELLDKEVKTAFIEGVVEDITDSIDGIATLLDRASQESIKSYVKTRFRPCDVFDRGDLEAWALYYGYEKVR